MPFFASIHSIRLFAISLFLYTSSSVPLHVVIQFILLCGVVVALSVNKPENLYHLRCCRFPLYLQIVQVLRMIATLWDAVSSVDRCCCRSSFHTSPLSMRNYVHCFTVHTFSLSLKFIKLYRIMCAHETKQGKNLSEKPSIIKEKFSGNKFQFASSIRPYISASISINT